jgi:SAM-dependent methyltransferase
MAKMTGERPVKEVTPDAVLAIHDAGYDIVARNISGGLGLDLGCGLGFETQKLTGVARKVIGIDYDFGALKSAKDLNKDSLTFIAMDCSLLGLKNNSVDWVCSSHLIEHFYNPAKHVQEIGRVLKHDGFAYFLTPNKPADFENPFHVNVFTKDTLFSLLSDHFNQVKLIGLDAKDTVKDEIAQRRAKAAKIYSLDYFDLRHKMPRSWWIWFYSKALPVAQKIVYRGSFDGNTGISAQDFFTTDSIDDSTLVLFATCSKPKKSGF